MECKEVKRGWELWRRIRVNGEERGGRGEGEGREYRRSRGEGRRTRGRERR